MADHDDDVVLAAASFWYFLNEDNTNEEERVPVKRSRSFWIHDTLQYIVDG